MSVTEGCNKDTRTCSISEAARSTIGTALYIRRKDVIRYMADENRLAAAAPNIACADPDFWKRELAGIDAALTELGLMII